jgi:hypothetical protein
MTLHPAARLALGASVGLGLACGSPTEPNTQRVVGTIDPGFSGAAVIDAPAEVRSGQAFSVTVRTVGSSSCTIPDGGLVVVTGALARITPYDQVPDAGHDLFCTRDYTTHPRTLSVTLKQAGPARLRVVGFSASTADPVLDSVEVQVTVAP